MTPIMQTITLQINNEDALKTIYDLENNHLISIIEDSTYNSPALPGSPMSMKEFKNWIKEAEAAPTISLEDFKAQWAEKKKKILSLIK